MMWSPCLLVNFEALCPGKGKDYAAESADHKQAKYLQTDGKEEEIRRTDCGASPPASLISTLIG